MQGLLSLLLFLLRHLLEFITLYLSRQMSTTKKSQNYSNLMAACSHSDDHYITTASHPAGGLECGFAKERYQSVDKSIVNSLPKLC